VELTDVRCRLAQNGSPIVWCIGATGRSADTARSPPTLLSPPPPPPPLVVARCIASYLISAARLDSRFREIVLCFLFRSCPIVCAAVSSPPRPLNRPVD
ncbi:hypothetical protein GWI33_016336, partial [Rhynchophorus ferrugineus]